MPASETRRSRWMIYALGGGLGHLTRAVSLARPALRRGHDVRILTNSPCARAIPVEWWLGADDCLEVLDLTLGPADARPIVAAAIERFRPDVFVVDTFPRGLGGELAELLPELACRRVLIHRDLNPRYIARAGLREFVASHYDRLILPGEPAPLADLPRAVATLPWLICDEADMLDQAEARAALGVHGPGRPVVAVVGCGRAEEVRASANMAARLAEAIGEEAAVRLVAPAGFGETIPGLIAPSAWPLLRVMRGIDLLVGAGGYHTVHEARATRTPLIAVPRPRLYDRQARRLSAAERVGDEEGAIRRTVAVLKTWNPIPSRETPRLRNGAHRAVRLIEAIAAGAPPELNAWAVATGLTPH
jgi:hypothetical protein